MIKRVECIDVYLPFINGFDNDPEYSDPHMTAMKETGTDLGAYIARRNRLCFASEKDGKTSGLFIFISEPDERYLELTAGLSRDRGAVNEMLSFLAENYPGYKADFVFNPRWDLMRYDLAARGAAFDTIQQKMVYTHTAPEICTEGVEELTEKYMEQYLAMHEKDTYWTGEKVLSAPERFRIFVAIENGEVQGYIDVTHCFEENEPYDLFVKPECRRKSWGKKLLMNALRENEPKDMMLLVDVDNAPAIKLYEALGFIKKQGADTLTAHWSIG